MTNEPLTWALETPSPGGSVRLEWLFSENSMTGLRWRDEIIGSDDPRLRLGNLPCSDNGAPFPIQFRFDPATGKPLRRFGPDAARSSFPNLASDGFPVLQNTLQPRADAKSRISVPQGTMAIFSAGISTRIFCLTKDGELHFRASPTEWAYLQSFAKIDMPDYAFGIAAFEDGFAMVLGNAAIVCRIADGFPVLFTEIHRIEGAVFCGSPAILNERHVAFPIRRGNSVAIATFDLRSGDWQAEMEAGTCSVPDLFFSVPTQTVSRTPDTFWVGAHDYLVLGTDFGQPSIAIRRFPSGLTALAGAAVLRDERNTIHALARSDDFYAFVSLTNTPRIAKLEGPHLCSGQSRFYGRSFYPFFWDDSPIDLQIEVGAGSVLLPLAYRPGGVGVAQATLLMKVEGIRDIAPLLHQQTDEWFSGQLYWHAGAQLHPLQVNLKFRSRFDIVIHCETDALVVGSALNGQFSRLSAS